MDVTETVLSFEPWDVPVTLTLKLHEPLAARVPPERLMEEEPATARMPPLPQVPDKPFGVDTTMPEGSESLNATPVNGDEEFGLVIVNVSEIEELRNIVEAPKTFVMEGGERVPVPVRPRV